MVLGVRHYQLSLPSLPQATCEPVERTKHMACSSITTTKAVRSCCK